MPAAGHPAAAPTDHYPAGRADLTTIRRSLRSEPASKLEWTVDAFGNLIATATFTNLTTELALVSEAEVEQTAPEWPVLATDPTAHSYSLDDTIDLGRLAQPGWLTSAGERVAAWAPAFVMGPQTDTLSLLKDLNAGMLADITYRVRDEEGTQSPADTLDIGSGSCRDIAGLFIEAARDLGFGARAVSGYLLDLDQVPDEAGSTHAWRGLPARSRLDRL